jgi:hypothetical protein
MSYTSKDYIYKANRIEQGTGVNTKHYGADDGGGWKFGISLGNKNDRT